MHQKVKVITSNGLIMHSQMLSWLSSYSLSKKRAQLTFEDDALYEITIFHFICFSAFYFALAVFGKVTRKIQEPMRRKLGVIRVGVRS